MCQTLKKVLDEIINNWQILYFLLDQKWSSE